MPKLNVLNQAGEKVSDIELNSEIFDIEINEHAVYTMVKNHLANRRQGTQSAKTRAEVRGGGRKPYRQKGTGRARHGSTRSPIWVGGGVTFAPKPRDYSYRVPKKIRRLALKSALTSKVQEEELIVLDQLSFEDFGTKAAVNVLKNIDADPKALVVLAENDEKVYKSFRNIKNVKVCTANFINVYDLVKYNSLIVTQDAMKKIEEVFS
ncbi:MAG: 50S ribosomal protein L4 [Tissierellia bacterium]|nr:50S ribosomal protein L4 [Tissierellia bacterium]